MKLIKPSEISGRIMTLIEEADEKLILISPYYNISRWDKLLNRIRDLKDRRIYVELYVREFENASIKEITNQGFKFNTIPNLHTKLYLNEKEAIVSYMNLNQSSDTNSLDIALATENETEYKQLVEYYERYIKKYRTQPDGSSKSVVEKVNNKSKYTAPQERGEQSAVGLMSEVSCKAAYEREKFIKEWTKHIRNNYSSSNFRETTSMFYADDLNKSGANFSTEYGFATITINVTKQTGQRMKDIYYQHFLEALSGYRLYWNSPFDKLSLYHNKEIEFKNINDDIKYCAEGLNQLL
jgi:hypothetical protein